MHLVGFLSLHTLLTMHGHRNLKLTELPTHELFSCVILRMSLTVLRLHMGDGRLLHSIYLTNAALQSVEKLLMESLIEL